MPACPNRKSCRWRPPPNWRRPPNLSRTPWRAWRICIGKLAVVKAAPPKQTGSAPDRKSTRLNSSHSLHDALPISQLATPTESFQDAVARLAYLYWEARGCQGGSPEADWLRAEQELSAR